MTDLYPVLQKLLKLVKLFDGFSDQDAREFLAFAARVDVRPGEVVLREGENSGDAYIIASGRLRVVKSCDGADEVLATLGPGESFGEVALLDAGPRSATVVADTDAILLRFGRTSVASIPYVSAKLMRNVATMMAGRLRSASSQAVLARVALARAIAASKAQETPARPRTHRVMG